MNPGTTLLIIFGVIGLMIYILHALKVVKIEPFEDSIIGTPIQKDLKDVNSLLSALGTPDLGLGATTDPIQNESNTTPPPNPEDPIPSLSISASLPEDTAIPVPSDNIQMPAPIIPEVSSSQGESQTISDQQGSLMSNAQAESFMDKIPKRNKTRHRRRYVKKCPPMPDMTMYIRKDRIPCWGCVVK